MKFAMIIVESEEDPEVPSNAEREFDALARWWADLQAQRKVLASGKLAPGRTAHTVSWRDQAPVVTDGPFIEAKESVGGIGILEVESEAEAIEIAKTWPAKVGYRIEVRPFLISYDGGV